MHIDGITVYVPHWYGIGAVPGCDVPHWLQFMTAAELGLDRKLTIDATTGDVYLDRSGNEETPTR